MPQIRLDWRPPLIAAFSAFVVFSALILWTVDWGEIFYLLGAVLASALLLLAIFLAKAPHRITRLATFFTFVAVSFALVQANFGLRNMLRWSLRSKTVKASVLAEPTPPNGDLKHIEWDTWGYAGAGDTTVYLVLDPDDTLNHLSVSGKSSRLPCKVYNIQRLERRWYAVHFYTDTDWTHCP